MVVTEIAVASAPSYAGAVAPWRLLHRYMIYPLYYAGILVSNGLVRRHIDVYVVIFLFTVQMKITLTLFII